MYLPTVLLVPYPVFFCFSLFLKTVRSKATIKHLKYIIGISVRLVGSTCLPYQYLPAWYPPAPICTSMIKNSTGAYGMVRVRWGTYGTDLPPIHGCKLKRCRRAAHMKMLAISAQTIPLWVGRDGEEPPELCGCIPADPSFTAEQVSPQALSSLTIASFRYYYHHWTVQGRF